MYLNLWNVCFFWYLYMKPGMSVFFLGNLFFL